RRQRRGRLDGLDASPTDVELDHIRTRMIVRRGDGRAKRRIGQVVAGAGDREGRQERPSFESLEKRSRPAAPRALVPNRFAQQVRERSGSVHGGPSCCAGVTKRSAVKSTAVSSRSAFLRERAGIDPGGSYGR